MAVAPVPIYVALGQDGARHLTRLRADERVHLTRSPRQATILVVAGSVSSASVPALHAVHDQIPEPRGMAAIGVRGDISALSTGAAPMVVDPDDPGRSLEDLRADVLAGRHRSPTQGPTENPVQWRGVGPHGQGGEGMMGGTPYGRSMAMPPVEGRDGLALDRLSLRLGPFLPGLPEGVTLAVGLQGDVLADVELALPDPGTQRIGMPSPDVRTPEARAASGRAGALAELCALAGLPAVARRAARTALDPTPSALERLRRQVDRPWGLRVATDGIGRLPHDQLDATGRWRRWIDGASGVKTAEMTGDRLAPDEVAEAMVGMEVGQALMTLASLRVELDASIAAASVAGS